MSAITTDSRPVRAQAFGDPMCGDEAPRTAGRNSRATTASAAAATPTENTAWRQPMCCATQVAMGTPSTNPSELPEYTKAIARPASRGGTIRVAYAEATEKNSACAMPPTTRPAQTTAKDGASATIRFDTV